MVSNETGSESDFFSGISSAFASWTTGQFLSGAFLALYGLLVVVGTSLNGLFIHVSVRESLHTNTGHTVLVQLAVVDVCACVLVILPTFVSVIVGGAIFQGSPSACHGQHVVATTCLLVSVWFLTIGIVERALKTSCVKGHLRLFGNRCVVRLLVVCMWCSCLTVALATLVGQTVEYDKDLFQCAVNYEGGTASVHFLFTFAFYLPIIIVCACCCIVFSKKYKELFIQNIASSSDATDNGGTLPAALTKQTVERHNYSTTVFYLDMAPKRDSSRHYFHSLQSSSSRVGALRDEGEGEGEGEDGDALDHGGGDGNIKPHGQSPSASKAKWEDVVFRLKQRSRLYEAFADLPAATQHHQFMTFLVAWTVVMVAWSLYVAATFVDIYSQRCRGCHRLGVLLGQATFTLKPLVYIGHNHWYRSVCLRYVKGCCLRWFKCRSS